MVEKRPIGIFDSGIGGLSVFKDIARVLPEYDYVYLGDNARVPYGNRSFETVYQYTLECVQWLLNAGCPLVILACNTASAKALRNIQQLDLPRSFPDKKVLGVIRPTAEIIGTLTRSRKVGVFATQGTVLSDSYALEIKKFFPDVAVYQQACPMWVPLIENGEHQSEGGTYFIKKYVEELFARDADIDTILLGCTHYPLLADELRKHLPPSIQLVSQGPRVADSLEDYLKRHPEIKEKLTVGGTARFYTTDDAQLFDEKAKLFLDHPITSTAIRLA